MEKYVPVYEIFIHLLCVTFTREPSLNYSRVAVTSFPALAPIPTVDLMYCHCQASAILLTHLFIYIPCTYLVGSVRWLCFLSDSYPAFFLLIATTSKKIF